MKKLIEMELMLAGWRETHNGGFIVQLLVQPDDAEFFKGATAAKGKIAGQLYQTYWMPFTDDAAAQPVSAEKPTVLVPDVFIPADKLPPGVHVVDRAVDKKTAELLERAGVGTDGVPLPPKKKPHFPDGLTGLAVRWCADEHFQAWVSEKFPAEWLEIATGENGENDEDAAKHVICTRCKCQSRRSLNTDEFAAEIFKRDFLKPYQEARKEDGIDDGNPF